MLHFSLEQKIIIGSFVHRTLHVLLSPFIHKFLCKCIRIWTSQHDVFIIKEEGKIMLHLSHVRYFVFRYNNVHKSVVKFRIEIFTSSRTLKFISIGRVYCICRLLNCSINLYLSIQYFENKKYY